MVLGNTVLIKHAPNVQGSQNLLQKYVDASSLPTGVFSTVIVDVPVVEDIVAHDFIRGVSFTGSERVGRLIGEMAGRHLKKSVLELGGSDGYVVFDDADLERAAKACVDSRFINTGQSCVAAKRWIVHQDVAAKFTDLVMEQIQNIKMGDPQEVGTTIGPMARLDLRDELAGQVASSIDKGAKVLIGDLDKLEEKSCFFPPTLLSEVSAGQPAYEEELFGPVASIITAESNEEALKISNSSRFGLGGAIFSQNEDAAWKNARDVMDTGGVFINDFYKSVPDLPFGGVKASGIGRELSPLALYEFANIKTVALAH